mmetsp:Transcript_31550/g.90549  ORF Transcript_31550/g.90549 Transcript_31550/m.90549 type:complete len:211 (+) Transcript_31550:5471-6103(+)
MPSNALESSQRNGTVISLHAALFGRQFCPPQPADSMPSKCTEFLQMPATVICRGDAPLSRQWCPPQPAHGMPRYCFDLSQISELLISAQVAFIARHLCPLHPKHLMPSLSSELWQRTELKMSPHCAAPNARQLVPPHAQFIMYSVLATEHSQGSLFFEQLSGAAPTVEGSLAAETSMSPIRVSETAGLTPELVEAAAGNVDRPEEAAVAS